MSDDNTYQQWRHMDCNFDENYATNNPSEETSFGNSSNFGNFHADTSRNSDQPPAYNKFKQKVQLSRNYSQNKPYSRDNFTTHSFKSDNSGGNTEDQSLSAFGPLLRNDCDMHSTKSSEKSADPGSDIKYYEREDCDLKSTSLQGSGPVAFERGRSDWYQVIIYKASQCLYKKALELISEYVRPLEFTFYNFKLISNSDQLSFLVCDSDVAEKLFYSKGQIQVNDRLRLAVHVNSTRPKFSLSDKMLQAVRSALAERYDPNNNSLDLSKFHDDAGLFEADCFVPLESSDALKYVFDIIGSTLANLKSINLNSNGLFLRDHLTIVAKSVPQLKTISLKNNKFKKVADLKSLETLSLSELNLSGNPLCSDGPSVSAVYDMFPMFTASSKSEDVFELTSCQTTLPRVERGFVCSENAKWFVRVFLEQYFTLYDSSRSELALWYDNSAQFSLVAIDGVGKNPAINEMIKTSRNFLRDSNHSKKETLLFHGKQNVLNILEQLPRTRHDTGSFTCDCPVFNEHMAHVTVTGLYERLGPSANVKKMIVYFSRAFVIVRNSGGKFSIVSDQLFITNRTQEQYIRAFSGINGLDAGFGETELEQNLIKKLSLESGISLKVCQQYLVDAGYDYEQAFGALKRAVHEDSVPFEAFIVRR